MKRAGGSDEDEEMDAEAEEKAGRIRASTPEVAFGGGHYVVGENEFHSGDLVVLGGSADVRGHVTGSLVLIGARAEVSGNIGKDLVGVGSNVVLRDGVNVNGSVVNVLGRLNKPSGAHIRQDVVDLAFLDLSHFATGRSILTFFLWVFFWIKLLKAAFLFLAVALLTAIFSDRIAFGAEVLPTAIGRSFLFGLLVWVVVVAGCLVMAITIVGLPLCLLAGLAFKLAVWAGIAIVSCAIGQQVGRNLFGRALSPFAATLLGYVLLVIVYLVPIFGGLTMGLVSVIGVGLLTVTRLATRLPRSPLPGMVQPPPPSVSPAGGTVA